MWHELHGSGRSGVDGCGQAAKAIERANGRLAAEAKEAPAVRAVIMRLQNEDPTAKAKAAWAKKCDAARAHHEDAAAAAAAEVEAWRAAVMAANDEITARQHMAWLEVLAEGGVAWEAWCDGPVQCTLQQWWTWRCTTKPSFCRVRYQPLTRVSERPQFLELLFEGPCSRMAGPHVHTCGTVATDAASQLQVRAAEVASMEGFFF